MKYVEFLKFWSNKTKHKILDLWGYEAEAKAEAFPKSRSWSQSFEFLKPRSWSRSFGLKYVGFMKPKQLCWNLTGSYYPIHHQARKLRNLVNMLCYRTIPCHLIYLIDSATAIFDILHSPWHNHWKNYTLSGTNLVFKTLPLLAHCLKTLPSVALKLAKMVP